MTGLQSSIARLVNKLFGRTGKFWDGPYHASIKKSPSETRNALHYVLQNAAKHGVLPKSWLDPFSSGRAIAEVCLEQVHTVLDSVREATTWLLRCGWRRAGPLPSLRSSL